MQKAIKLNEQAVQLYQQGKFAEATKMMKQALAMYQRLYPRGKYPQGHPDLATSLHNLGTLLWAQGEYAAARPYLEQALAMRQRLYPKAQYPQGHPDLAQSLNNLGALLQAEGEYAAARAYYQQALAMDQRLYPKAQYPQGHRHVATSLHNLGNLLRAQGEYAAARDYLQQALAMFQRLYPKAKHPQGHADLATSLHNLGGLLWAQGEYAAARAYLQQALAMRQRLYPKGTYPQGHPLLAICLNNLGGLLWAQGEYAAARDYYQQALAMDQRLYPKGKYPQGHPALATSLHNLGNLLLAQGEYAAARDYLEKALAMDQRLYPKAKYPQGHPALATSLNNLGFLLQDQGEYAAARDSHQQALAMRRRLYPKAQYPQGHPDLATSLHTLGFLLRAEGEYAAAGDYLQQALAMRHQLATIFVPAAAEAEVLNYLESLPWTRDGLLSVTGHLPQTDALSYRWVWRTKAAIMQALQSRHQALTRAAQGPRGKPDPGREKIRDLGQQLRAKRAELSRLLLRPDKDAKAHRERLQKISTAKEELERQLAKLLPPFARQQALQRLGPSDLLAKLPRGTVFIDLLRYVRFDQDPKVRGRKGERRTLRYVAFVLRPGQPVQRVELGRAAPIDKATAAWRQDIKDKKGSGAAAKLRDLVWAPLAKQVPADTQTVFLAPDGELTRVPWAALPGSKQGTVLLEGYALAVVPHGPFLLDRLTAAADLDRKTDFLLAVGGVRYDYQPQAADAKQSLAWARSAVRGEGRLVWDNLPGTLTELKQVVARAGRRPVRQWSGAKASTARLLADLPEARWAHLATHGFFADQKFRSFLQLDEKLYERRGFWEGPPPGARNPLVLSGLVLAGANLPAKKGDPLDEGDGGILTAEVIAGLPLQRLELVVLSACETGLGRVAGGEGVFGLQRAFHLAGAKNVVASLWKVDDQATAALMVLFYDKLWREKKTALVALREAQLTLYHHPERIKDLAKERGPKLDKIVRLPIQTEKGTEPKKGGKAAPKLWAGFVLSGIGR
jgi:CHAT domain-containing protein/Tfp pilus assembly protein PilF